ncbi:MAG: sulfite exporter TauE/SafE family protein [Alphaproteobacteria bacterium]|nr:sulfite exporter TauE/SafE family protein [Alphaproteobacteria bacterium]
METVAFFAAVGFVAQLVDGAIGMAYGLTASSLLLTFGLSPAVTSASVHSAEVFTTAASGLSHWRLGNFDRALFIRLMIPGMIGGAIGAWLLTSIPVGVVRPIVSAYLLIMGLFILAKALKPAQRGEPNLRRVPFVAGLGAVLDAIGGGGWGPMVTSTLIGWGVPPRVAIGTSNAAEFFVTVVIAGSLLPVVEGDIFNVIVGLVLGGVVAAPLAAYSARLIEPRVLMAMVGVVITALSVNDLGHALWS